MEEMKMAITLKASKRENLSRATTNELRNTGFIPSVVYGKEDQPLTISVNNLELLKTVRDEGRNAIIGLDIEDNEKLDVMLHEYQTHPVKGDVIHADFYVVDMKSEMDVDVPLNLVGEAAGVKEGGILQQPMYELQVRAKPRDIPEEITVNVEALEIGDSINVEDLPKAAEYEFLDEPDATVANVLPPEEEEEETEEDVDFSAEPELVGAEDEDEEEEA